MKEERPKPYIGVSGVVNVRQQRWLQDQFERSGLHNGQAGRRLALGVKAVHKTQFLDIPNKYGTEWYPVGEDGFSSALEPSPTDQLRVAQIYMEPDNTGDPEYRDAFMSRIRKRGQAWLNAVQFDLLPWHSDDSLLSSIERIKDETGLWVILQAHRAAMDELGPDGTAKRLGRYAHALDYILFDASHGKGVRMDTAALSPFLYAGYSHAKLETTGFGVAGGLDAATIREDLPAITSEYPDVSWDAEGRLHPVADDGTRALDLSLAKQYFEASYSVLQGVQ